jgi:hypothetical protein
VDLERDNAALRTTLDEQNAHLDSLIARLEFVTERERELRALLLDAHEGLLRRDEEIERLRARDRQLADELASAQVKLRIERERLQRFTQRRYWRLRLRIKRLLGR